MYDQNPMLHKLDIDALARDHQAKPEAHDTSNGTRRFGAIAFVLTVIVAAVFLNDTTIV